MRIRFSTWIAALIVLFPLLTLQAQTEKYGHVNFGNLLEQMPETQEADEELATFRDSLLSKHEAMVKSFETRYGEYIEKTNQGLISQVERKKREADLQKEQERILTFEREIQQKVGDKRQTLLDPILTRLNGAIQTMGREGNFTAIFDTSVGAMLYAEESRDITKMVREELDLPNEE